MLIWLIRLWYRVGITYIHVISFVFWSRTNKHGSTSYRGGVCRDWVGSKLCPIQCMCIVAPR